MKDSCVAVIISVYKNDRLSFFTKAIDSMLEQTHKPCDLFIAIDGPLPSDLKSYIVGISSYDNIFVSFYDINKGLAFRLNQLIADVVATNKYKYIARMDADDISVNTRIEKQVSFFRHNIDISVVGSDLIEINEDDDEVFYKAMPQGHDELSAGIIKKCPFNHPSVMFRTEVFSTAIRYNANLKNTQDYYLWVDLLNAGFKFANINEPLLKFRIDSSFHSRRGFGKAMNDLRSRFYAFKILKCYTLSNFFHVFLLFALRISPNFIKSFAYKKFR
jgi:hypothetical protein